MKRQVDRLRRALTQAVMFHLRYETNLKRFYSRLANRKPKQVAVMATASKMLKVIYLMLHNSEPYHPGPRASLLLNWLKMVLFPFHH